MQVVNYSITWQKNGELLIKKHRNSAFLVYNWKNVKKYYNKNGWLATVIGVC